MPVLQVCATPDAGLWSTGTTGDPAPLAAKVSAVLNYTVNCSQLGQNPSVHWANGPDPELFPITGFAAEMLLVVLNRMGPDYDCVVHLLPTYTKAIYATTRQQVCDLAFTTFSNTANNRPWPTRCLTELMTAMKTCARGSPSARFEPLPAQGGQGGPLHSPSTGVVRSDRGTRVASPSTGPRCKSDREAMLG